ncbi:MAG: hypothetical protein ACRDRU_24320, partial [Pseudonocardiaceae bacterium]
FPGRTLTYDYAPTVAPATTANPLITKVTEVSGTTTRTTLTTVDLLGRITAYTDAFAQTTSYS